MAHGGHATFFFHCAIKSKHRAINENYRAITDKLLRDKFKISARTIPSEKKETLGICELEHEL